MDILLLTLVAGISSLAALFAFLAYLKCLKASSGPPLQPFENMVRTESERMRQATDESARGMRAELGQSMQRFQDSTLNAFSALGDPIKVHTRFSRWAKRGVWRKLFEMLASDADNEYGECQKFCVRAASVTVEGQ
jgi:hypothetical protein